MQEVSDECWIQKITSEMKRNIIWTKAPFFCSSSWFFRSVNMRGVLEVNHLLDPENHLGNEKEHHLNQSSIFLFQQLVFQECQHEGCSGSEPFRSFQVEKWEGLLCRASDFNGSHEKVRAFVKVDMGVKGEFVWWGFIEASRSYFCVKVPFTLEVLSVLMMMMMMRMMRRGRRRRRRRAYAEDKGRQWRSNKNLSSEEHQKPEQQFSGVA